MWIRHWLLHWMNLMSDPSLRPTGTVTFLFTDIEASTKMAQEYPEAMPALLRRHDEILTQAIQAHGGHIFRNIGDAFCAAFSSASDAVRAAIHSAAASLRRAMVASAGQGQDRAAYRDRAVEWRAGIFGVYDTCPVPEGDVGRAWRTGFTFEYCARAGTGFPAGRQRNS